MTEELWRRQRVDDELVLARFDGSPHRAGPSALAAAIAPDRSRVAVVTGQGLALFDRDGALVAGRPCGPWTQVAFNADASALLASGWDDEGVWILDANTLETRGKIEHRRHALVYVCPSPAHARWVLVAHETAAVLYDLARGAVERELSFDQRPPSHPTLSACFSSDGTLVAISEPGALSLWDVRSGELLARVKTARDLLRLASSTDGGRWFGASRESLIAFDARTAVVLAERNFDRAERDPIYLAPSVDGARLHCVTSEGAVLLASSETLEVLGRVERNERVRSVSVARDGFAVLCTEQDGDRGLAMGPLDAGTLDRSQRKLTGMVFDGESTLFARYHRGRRKLVIDGAGSANEPNSYAVSALFDQPQKRPSEQLFHRGSVLATTDWRSGAAAALPSFAPSVFFGALSCHAGDGAMRAGVLVDEHGRGERALLAIASRTSAKRATVIALRAAQWWIESVAFSPSGQRIAVADADGTIRVFDLARAFEAAAPAATGAKRAKKTASVPSKKSATTAAKKRAKPAARSKSR